MPKLKPDALPAYRLHKQSGQAIVTLSGRDFLLGKHGSDESRAEYDRLTAEWLANGRRLRLSGVPQDLTVAELAASYFGHAQDYYRAPDGSATSEVDTVRQALRPLLRLYGRANVRDFGPLALKAVRQTMIDAPPPQPVASKGRAPARQRIAWCRGYANKQIARIKLVFKWGVENELVPAEVYQALQAVAGLRKGRCEARESEPVRPVPQAHVDAALQHMSPQVGAMVRLQLLTGMRPGEAVAMRTGDLHDTNSRVWTYRPGKHKTEHHGHTREIRIGPRAQEVLRPFLKPDLAAHIFSPAEAEAWRHEQQRLNRKTKVQPSQVRRAPPDAETGAPRSL